MLHARLAALAAAPLRSAARRRALSSAAAAAAEAPPPRDVAEYDVAIVGGGPAGLSAAIRLKQRAGDSLSVCVIEKGHEVGAHILSGNVFEPRALNELLPDWRERGAPLDTPAAEDVFLLMTSGSSSVRLPTVPMLHNEGNFVTSLGRLARWLGAQAEALGVDVLAGAPVAEVLYSGGRDAAGAGVGHVVGVATADAGVGRDGRRKDSFARGMEVRAKQTLLAEGAKGSCTEEVAERFELRDGRDPQTYGLGLKEVWRVPKERLRPGYIQHSLGWPLQHSVYGGSFLYHMQPDLVLLGMVVGLDYANPYVSPYREFQRWKHHPEVRRHIEGGECIQYGARVINEGGLQAIPKLTFPGGALVGCAAGFLNVPKIKGTHTAMKSGMVAADAVFDALRPAAAAGAPAPPAPADGLEVSRYQADMEESWVYEELRAVRNYHPSFKLGLLPGMAYSGLSAYVLGGREPWTFRNTKTDAEKTQPAAGFAPIEYPKPDGVLSFDLLTNLARSGTNHEADQPSHLRVRAGMEQVPVAVSHAVYAAPESRFCPARVYEFPEPEKKGDAPQLVINASNCLHCKACAVKTPKNYIKWTVPEAGGGGPSYEIM